MLNLISVVVLTYEFIERPTSWKLSSLSRRQIRNVLVFSVEMQAKMIYSNEAEAFVATIKYSSFCIAQALKFCVCVPFCDCIPTWLQWLRYLHYISFREKAIFQCSQLSLSATSTDMPYWYSLPCSAAAFKTWILI